MAIQRAKSSDGAGFVNTENETLEDSSSPANAKALPARYLPNVYIARRLGWTEQLNWTS